MKSFLIFPLILLFVSCKSVANFQIIENVKPNPKCKFSQFVVVEPDFYISTGANTLSGCIEKIDKTSAMMFFYFSRTISKISASVNLTTGESSKTQSFSGESATARGMIPLNTKTSLEIPTADKKGSFMYSILYTYKNNQPSIEIYDVTREESYAPRLAFQAISKNDLSKLKELFASGAVQKDTKIILYDGNDTSDLNLFQQALNVRANKEIFEYLLEKKVDFQYRDKLGFTALTYSVFFNDLELLKYIDSLKKWNLNETTNQGDTILHWAAANKNKPIVDYLLKRGISKDIKNNQGLTAYDIAKSKLSYEIMEILQ
ncbi:ankyrin repeat domain-containing protein [Leptospira sp. 2 VSF19]|uniref:Ankyrin repeat domain-containing protein n=1 Tax=Leptospira soteropolitanensis TaxID=2950025 RepID=A0AAW5VI73_9LEPT|nr:ankyrin repeat domain-containing protein [Leptospira soteropolitanensis]MCW7492294.1 ankyrin repeat domain-containing protein [Leptospira soteropolitanensis]MCW7499876.1 ankyrin repeat domain-containing protein [Leptospira soteropolitanensis]MCW7522127.1 ankyrin repeat domain-containing protein [Leptospira soteropolitanensis]MCW7525981.1 ankyrin repeat domain-containing protein [Leptospira soteropolitanensis]MCW7529905.1 ankyrin repeat domain-containing protein [Leptospira soteropolitanensi